VIFEAAIQPNSIAQFPVIGAKLQWIIYCGPECLNVWMPDYVRKMPTGSWLITGIMHWKWLPGDGDAHTSHRKH